ISRPVPESVSRNTTPQKIQHVRGAVVTMDARTTELDQFRSNCFIRTEIELAFAVVAEIGTGRHTGLQAVRTDYLALGKVFNNQVITDSVKFIRVVTCSVGGPARLTQ